MAAIACTSAPRAVRSPEPAAGERAPVGVVLQWALSGTVGGPQGPTLRRTRGLVREDASITNDGATPIDVTLVCVVDASQVPCNPDATTYRARVAPGERATHRIRIDAQPGQRLHLLRMIDGDRGRPIPASGASSFVVGGGSAWTPARGARLSAPPAPWGGCDFAALVTDPAPKTSFRPVGTLAAGDELHLVLSRCGSGTTDVAVLVIAERRTVLDGVVPRIVRLDGEATVPLALPDDVEEVQIAMLDASGSATFSHAVAV